MKKALLRTMLLLCALIAGSSSAWADEYVKVTSTGGITDGEYLIVYEAGSVAFDGSLSTLDATGNTVAVTINDGKIASSAKIDAATFTIDVTKGTLKSSSGLYIGVSSNSNGLKQIADENAYKNSFAIDGDGNAVISAVFSESTMTLRYNKATNQLRFRYYKSGQEAIALYKKTATSSSKVATPTISGNTPFLTSTEVSITCGTEEATIQYSTDNGTSWNNYSKPFTLTETTTVKAKATVSGLTDSDEAIKTFTKVTPMTVAAALTAINTLDDNGTKEDQCVAGIISKIDSYSSNAITYWISDDGTTTSQLEVYKGKGLNGANFTAKTDMNVGDQVTVYGTLKKYVTSSNTTPEFDAGSQLLSYEATGAPTPIINASNVTIDSEAKSGEITYTIDNPTAASLTAAVKEGDWISNVQVDAANSKVTFSVTQNTTAEQRIGYITLSYEGATNKDVKITQKATYGTATLPFVFDGGKADVESTPGLTQTGLGSDYSASPKLKFDGTGDELVLRINEAPGALYFDIKGNGFSGSTFKVQTSMNGTDYEDLATYTELTNKTQTELFNLPAYVRYIKWVYTEKVENGGNVALGNINLIKENGVKIGDAGYTTFWGMKDYNFTGLTAYVVSEINTNSVTLTEITSAPAWTGVILKGEAGVYVLEETDKPAEVGTNLLQTSRGGNFGGESATYDLFALAKKDDVVGFYKVKDGVTIPAYKCFLSIKKEASAPEYLAFILGGETTNIADVRSKMEDVKGEVYDLLGRRVAQPTKGLYIVNGKKVVLH